ncbi:MAG: glycine zipper 2TM domain-containing protein [Pseudomonadota bacterium]
MRPALRPFLATAAAALGAAGTAPAAFAADQADVVSSTPVYATVAVLRQACSNEQQVVQRAPSGAGALIGAIAGGLIGNTVGGGFGRAAATGLGAVAGSAIGNQIEADGQPAAAAPVRRCQTVTRLEDRVVGYDVMYEVAGQRYSTRLARDPGTRLAVALQPADANGGMVPAPLMSSPVPSYDAPVDTAEAPPPPIYHDPLPPPVYYYPAPSYYVAPSISFGIGYIGGWRGGRYRR